MYVQLDGIDVLSNICFFILHSVNTDALQPLYNGNIPLCLLIHYAGSS